MIHKNGIIIYNVINTDGIIYYYGYNSIDNAFFKKISGESLWKIDNCPDINNFYDYMNFMYEFDEFYV